jgi:hypothetical protein
MHNPATTHIAHRIGHVIMEPDYNRLHESIGKKV